MRKLHNQPGHPGQGPSTPLRGGRRPAAEAPSPGHGPGARAGRWTARAGLNSVVLSWEPNTQSRVRGYRVYRASGESPDTAAFERLTSPWTPLPTYRDYPPEIRDYAYRVTAMSRFYTAGNSTPTETESRPTALLPATLGGVTLTVRDAAGRWTIRATGGEIAAGEGTLLTLRFRAAEGAEGEASVTLVSALLRAESGQTATAPTPVSATVSLQLRNPPEPAHVDVSLEAVEADVDGGRRVSPDWSTESRVADTQECPTGAA